MEYKNVTGEPKLIYKNYTFRYGQCIESNFLPNSFCAIDLSLSLLGLLLLIPLVILLAIEIKKHIKNFCYKK